MQISVQLAKNQFKLPTKCVMYTFQLLVIAELTPCYKKRIILEHPVLPVV